MTIRAALIVKTIWQTTPDEILHSTSSIEAASTHQRDFSSSLQEADGVCNFLDATELTALLPPPADAVTIQR